VSAAAGGKSFAEFHARYIDGREPYPWGAILPLAGLRLLTDTLRTPTLGLATLPDSVGLQVSSVDPNSAGAEAGVKSGDYLLSVGDIPVNERGFAVRFRQKYGTTPGAPVSIRVRRGADTLNLTGRLRFEERIVMRLQPAPNASGKAARIRSGILHGKVGR
jgi:predicted metalloprotease with PDZ domain